MSNYSDQPNSPRHVLIDLITSPVGCMVTRRIDQAYRTSTHAQAVLSAVDRMMQYLGRMDEHQVRACQAEFDRFFHLIPSKAALPMMIALEMRYPHYIEGLPEAHQRLELIRKGGEYATLFDPRKLKAILACLNEVEAKP